MRLIPGFHGIIFQQITVVFLKTPLTAVLDAGLDEANLLLWEIITFQVVRTLWI